MYRTVHITVYICIHLFHILIFRSGFMHLHTDYTMCICGYGLFRLCIFCSSYCYMCVSYFKCQQFYWRYYFQIIVICTVCLSLWISVYSFLKILFVGWGECCTSTYLLILVLCESQFSGGWLQTSEILFLLLER